MKTSLRRLLIQSATLHANRPAILVDGIAISYQELFEQANVIADILVRETPESSSVGIHCQRDRYSLVGILSAVLAHRAYVPLNPSFPDARIQGILDIAQPSIIITNPENYQVTKTFKADSAIIVNNKIVDSLSCANGVCTAQSKLPNDTCYLMFTSGTTGTPKGVAVSEENLLSYLNNISDIADLTPEDRTSHYFDLSFDLSVHDIFVTWTSGSQLCVLPKSRALQVVDFAKEIKLTSWFSVPSVAALCGRLRQLQPGSLNLLKTVLFCGEPLPVSIANKFREAANNSKLWNLYGPTEATIAFTAFQMESGRDLGAETVVPLGFPIGDLCCKVEIDQDGVSELLLGGSQVASGYMNNPDLTKSRFVTDENGVRYYRTGDVVEYSEDLGYLFRGRKDDQVKINGHRVELAEIDHVIREAAGTLEVAAITFATSDNTTPDQIVAFVVDPKVDIGSIKAICRKRLASYMVPRKIIVIESMPLSASGKIDRKALQKLVNSTS